LDKELKEVVHAWLAAQPKMFFSEGIKKLVQWWKKCIEKKGDYVEKLCYYKFSIFIEIKFVSVVPIITDSPTYEGVSKSPRTMLITHKSLVVHEFPARVCCGGVL